MPNKEQKKMQKVARRKKIAKQHQVTDEQLKRRVLKTTEERMKDIQLRRLKKAELQK